MKNTGTKLSIGLQNNIAALMRVFNPLLDVIISADSHMLESVYGWFQPRGKIGTFLENYSRAGSTHHGMIVYDVNMDDFATLAKFMGWEWIRL